MSKIYKISFVFLLLIALLSSYIILSAQKIDTKQAINKNTQKNDEKENNPKVVAIPMKIQEDEYTESIDKITKEYQSFIDSVNEEIKAEQIDSETVYPIFNHNDTVTIEKINKNLNNTLVPGKYKEFHLLLSRSLLKLSSYINTSNPNDMLAGLRLFEQAREEYDRLDIG